MSAPSRSPTGSPPAARLTIGIIGAGRVGAVLGAALRRAGHHVPVITTGSRPDRLRMLLPGIAVAPAAEVTRAATDLLLLTVPDDALAQVVRELPDPPTGQVVAHTCGAHGLAVLAPAVARGARPLAMHPAMTFTGEIADLGRLVGIGYGVTAPAALRQFATRLVADLGGFPEWLAEPARPLYHAALAHGANHLVTLVNEAADLLRATGVRGGEQLLGPLLRAALDNTLRHGDAALTGPVARGDAGTVDGHLRALAQAAPEAVAAYQALARRTADRAIATGRLSARDAEALLEVLAQDRSWEPA
jgi:predicted short-subunit dehydrogenase-like oxidoreductase (DUF2520 family)